MTTQLKALKRSKNSANSKTKITVIIKEDRSAKRYDLLNLGGIKKVFNIRYGTFIRHFRAFFGIQNPIKGRTAQNYYKKDVLLNDVDFIRAQTCSLHLLRS